MMKLKKNIALGRINFLIIFFFFISSNIIFPIKAQENQELLEGKFIEIKILDKVSSKSNL